MWDCRVLLRWAASAVHVLAGGFADAEEEGWAGAHTRRGGARRHQVAVVEQVAVAMGHAEAFELATAARYRVTGVCAACTFSWFLFRRVQLQLPITNIYH